MQRYQFTSVERILSKFNRDFRGIAIQEDDAIEWIGEALGFMEYPTALESCVTLLPVRNHEAVIPQHLKYVVQIVKSNRSVHIEDIRILEEEIPVEEEPGCTDCGGFVSNLVPVDSQGFLIGDYDVAYYRPLFDNARPEVRELKFSPVKLSNHTFFDSVVCQLPGMEELYSSCVDEYTINQNKLRFSFKNGYVAVAYLKVPTDERDYPMVPDDVVASTAITYYLGWKVKEMECWNHREGACQLAEKAERKWNEYVLEFNNNTAMPSSVDDYQDMMVSTKYIVPRENTYYGYFGALGHAEQRPYNDPDNRNNRFYRLRR
jgi:hypothetical protein